MTLSAPLFLLLSLVACEVSASPEPQACVTQEGGACAPGPNSAPMSAQELAQATQAAQEHLAHIQGLPEHERRSAGASLELLAANSFMTRAAMLVPMVLEQSVSAIPPESIVSERRGEWEDLQAGLKAHVQTLEAMGVVLGSPELGEELFGLELAKSREDVLFGGRPVEDAGAVCDAIPSSIPLHLLELDRQHTREVNRITGQPWTLNPQLAAWHQALNSLEPAVTNPADKAQVLALIRMMNGYFAHQGC